METDWLRIVRDALLGILFQPFYYIAILLIVMQYLRQIRQERQLFGVKLLHWQGQLVCAVAAGWIVGLVLSVVGIFVGFRLTPDAVLWLWGISVLLALLRVRFLCFAYAAGALGLLQPAVVALGLPDSGGWIGRMADSLAQLDIAGLLLLVALLHLAEALLVRVQGDRLSTPLFLLGKRGKLVGAYALQGYWPVPLFLLVPAASGIPGAELPWMPLAGDGGGYGWTLLALPTLVGFSELTRTMLPERKAGRIYRGLLLYSIGLGAVAAAAIAWAPLVPIAALFALLLHEALIWAGRLQESTAAPLYVHPPEGLRILGVVPGTPAEAMGLMSGEVLLKVNGMSVRTRDDLYRALHLQSAYAKLEVLNRDGQQKFVQRARYAGDHHQLGVILAPDDQAGYYVEPGAVSALGLLRRRRDAKRRETAAPPLP
ncbi:serine protease [Paenibacillus sp. 32O-W]|uniref:PDZ domain-containing protein n=1 Tax=Paenibacillus sp. 32O-W TaxID=1695218 RepID=UPI00071EDF6C|nr:PDZ domain-containing protein [Paenibacillus sp. 32O-W]ALS26125.1 serine protease [Paenibacillus sp. 32O-W]